MNKAELVEALAQHYDGSKVEASRALNAVVQTITRSTAAGEKVAITGFGVFEKVDRPARMVRNPRTGERKEAPATSVPRFRAGTELKAYVAGQRALPELSIETPAPAARPARTSARRPAAAATEPVAEQEPLVAASEIVEEVPVKAGKSSKKADSKKAEGKKVGQKADAGRKADAGKKAVAAKAATQKAVATKADSKKAVSKKADSKKADSKKAGGKKAGKKK